MALIRTLSLDDDYMYTQKYVQHSTFSSFGVLKIPSVLINSRFQNSKDYPQLKVSNGERGIAFIHIDWCVDFDAPRQTGENWMNEIKEGK